MRPRTTICCWGYVGEVDGRTLSVLGEGRGVVGVEVVARVSAGGEVDGSGQRHIGISLGILRVAPQNLEVGLLGVVGQTLVSEYGFEVRDIEAAGVTVTLDITRPGRQTPRPLSIDFAGECKVHILIYGEVVAAITQVETAVVVIAKSREYHAGGVGLCKWKVSEGHSHRQWQTGKYQIGGSGHDILAGMHLALGNLKIEVGAIMVIASGVFSVLKVIHSGAVFFWSPLLARNLRLAA